MGHAEDAIRDGGLTRHAEPEVRAERAISQPEPGIRQKQRFEMRNPDTGRVPVSCWLQRPHPGRVGRRKAEY